LLTVHIIVGTGSGVHAAFYSGGIGAVTLGVKWSEPVANLSLQYSAEGKDACSYIPTSPCSRCTCSWSPRIYISLESKTCILNVFECSGCLTNHLYDLLNDTLSRSECLVFHARMISNKQVNMQLSLCGGIGGVAPRIHNVCNSWM
jgi:hypothetical protein